MTSRSLSRRQLSRSKIELFLECPRCFHEDVARGNARPSGPPFTLNNAVDELLKREFDDYRRRQKPHPLFDTVGLDAVPLQDERLGKWRHNFTGVRWTDPDTGWTLFGAVDDLWRRSDGRVIVADYKATAKNEELTAEALYPSYRRQAEIYQFLVERQGFEVDDRAWFVWTSGIKTADRFDDRLSFRTVLVHHDGDRSWVAEAFRAAVHVAVRKTPPKVDPDCEWCDYVARRSSRNGNRKGDGTL
jgi:hypothetical protein